MMRAQDREVMGFSLARDHDPVARRWNGKETVDAPVLRLVARRTPFDQKKSFDHCIAPLPLLMNIRPYCSMAKPEPQPRWLLSKDWASTGCAIKSLMRGNMVGVLS